MNDRRQNGTSSSKSAVSASGNIRITTLHLLQACKVHRHKGSFLNVVDMCESYEASVVECIVLVFGHVFVEQLCLAKKWPGDPPRGFVAWLIFFCQVRCSFEKNMNGVLMMF